MKTVIRLCLVLMVVAMLAPAAAYAQYTDYQSGSEPCADTMNPDDCMFDTSTSWGQAYYYCIAKASWGGMCADLVYTQNGTPFCGNVKYAAHCQCDTSKTPKTYGNCTYQQ